MMSEPTTVDGITRDELTGKVVLLIEENRPWLEHELMHQQLSAKVRNYVRFIRSSDFAAEHGERPEDTIVRLVNTVPPGEGSLEFFGRVSWELAKHRIAFEHQVGEEGIPDEIAPIAPGAGVAAAPEAEAAAPPPADTQVEEEAVPEPELPELEVTPDEVGVPELAGLEPEVFEATPPIEEEIPLESMAPGAELDTTLEVEPPPDLETAEVTRDAPPDDIAPPAGFESGFPVLDEETLLEEMRPEEPVTPEEGAAPEETAWEPAAVGEVSELERLLEANDELEQLLEEVAEPEPAPPEPATAEVAGKPRKPSFFPEEEFGRALPDMDQVEAILSVGPGTAEGDEPVIETSSGKRISLATPVASSKARRGSKAPAKLLRAALAAGSAALAGAVVWAVLSVGAGHGASPLAVAVGLMVGISVRLKGEGHTLAFRLVGVFGTLFGSAIGGLMAATALTAFQSDLGIAGALSVLGDPAAILSALDKFYGPLDLVSVVLAAYIAFRLSASKPSS